MNGVRSPFDSYVTPSFPPMLPNPAEQLAGAVAEIEKLKQIIEVKDRKIRDLKADKFRMSRALKLKERVTHGISSQTTHV